MHMEEDSCLSNDYEKQRKKILIVSNVDTFFISHRLPIALAAIKLGYEVHLAARQTLSIDTLQTYGFEFHPLCLTRNKTSPITVFREFLELLRLVRSIRPDIIHLVTIKPVLLGGIVARVLKVPFMVSAIPGLGFVFINSGRWAKFRRMITSFLYKIALKHRNASLIFQNSDDLATIQKIVNCPKDSVELIRGSGVDLGLYLPQPEPAGIPVVLLASRLIADKGVREFVEAAKLVRKKIEVRFILVGEVDPEYSNSLSKEEILSWVNDGLVEWWGHSDNMPKMLACCHIVALPSYREGLPKVLIEAAACGRPVITTDTPGCRDAIIPNQTGVLVPVKDAEGLANAIRYLSQTPMVRRAMGTAARSFAEEVFDIKQVVAAHLKIYEKGLSND